MSLCGEWWWRLVSESGYWHEFRSHDWEATFERKDPGEGFAEIDSCDAKKLERFTPWCDHLQLYCDGDLAASYSYLGYDPDDEETRVFGVGWMQYLKTKRRQPNTRTFNGTVGQLWAQQFQIGADVGDINLYPELTAGGPPVQISSTVGDPLGGAIDILTTYTTWAEHGGANYTWIAGEEPRTGRVLTSDWVLPASRCIEVPEFNSAAVVTDLLFMYGPQSDQPYNWNAPDDGKCARQSGRLDFPEITSQAAIIELADYWGPLVAAPEPVLDSVQLNPATTKLKDLRPGIWHPDDVTAHRGYEHNLARATISGEYSCVEIEAEYDQGASEIRRRIAA